MFRTRDTVRDSGARAHAFDSPFSPHIKCLLPPSPLHVIPEKMTWLELMSTWVARKSIPPR